MDNHRLGSIKHLFHDPTTHQVADNISKLLKQHAEMFEQICDELDKLEEVYSFNCVMDAAMADIKSACLYGENYF